MARPSKLTPRVRDRLVAATRAGAFAEVAARSAGISPSTYYSWLARAEHAQVEPQVLDGQHVPVGERAFVELADELEVAAAEAEVNAVAVVRKAMSDDWKAATWYLERARPERWRRRTSTDLQGEVRVDADVQVTVGSPEVTKAAHDFLRVSAAA